MNELAGQNFKFKNDGTSEQSRDFAVFALLKQPEADAQTKVEGPPTVEIPVYFATDRAKLGSNEEESDRTLSELKTGTAIVRVPSEPRWYSGSGLKKALIAQNWKVNPFASTIKPFIELRGYVAETDRSKVLNDVKSGVDFWQDLNARLKSAERKRVYVYIHGFASSGENALYSAGVLSSQLEAPVVAFSWPSAGRVGRGIFGPGSTRALFKNDRKMIDNPNVVNDLANFLSTMRERLAADTEIALVSHSLGGRLLTRLMKDGSSAKFDSLDLIAPDVDKNLFLSALPEMSKRSNDISVYLNPGDKVLYASSLNDLLQLKWSKKLGKAEIPAPGINFVDYQVLAEPRRVGHYLPFDQFASLERTGQPSRLNGQDFFLYRRSKIVEKE